MMSLILVLTILCALALAFTGVLNLGLSVLLVTVCLYALVWISYQHKKRRDQIRGRCRQLGATWGGPVRHLGGLPIPAETPASLFLLQDQLLLESEHLVQSFPFAQIRHIVPMPAEQISSLPDQALCRLLDVASCRPLSSSRDKIRRGDSSLRKSMLLLLILSPDQDKAEDTYFIVLVLDQPYKYLQPVLRKSVLAPVVTPFHET